MANARLLRSTLEYIKTNPTEWDQTRFFACFAGWTLRLNLPVEVETTAYAGTVLTLDGKPLFAMDIDREAAALLDLTREQQAKLFCGGNSLADLEAFVSALIEGRRMPAHAELLSVHAEQLSVHGCS
jgi:hypothetical protein